MQIRLNSNINKQSLHICFVALDYRVAEQNAKKVIYDLSEYYSHFKGPIPLKKEYKNFKTQRPNNFNDFRVQEHDNVLVHSVKVVLYGMNDEFMDALQSFSFSSGVSIEFKYFS